MNKKKRKKKKKTITIFCVILVILLLFSSAAGFALYVREKNNLRHSVMPISRGDYYQEQLALVNNYKLLNNHVAEYKAEDSNKSNYQDIKEVPFIPQNPDYPNGCESVSATMLLQSYGIDITVEEFVNKYLKKNSIYSIDGERYGPDPRDTYAGDPTSKTGGFGIFEPGIKSAIERVLFDKVQGKVNYNVYGSETKLPLSDQVSSGLPIIIWATIDYEPVNQMFTWKDYNNEYTYTYPKTSHTIVVTGADEEYYYVNDPLQSQGNTKVEKKKLEDSFDSLGRQLVRIEMYNITGMQ